MGEDSDWLRTNGTSQYLMVVNNRKKYICFLFKSRCSQNLLGVKTTESIRYLTCACWEEKQSSCIQAIPRCRRKHLDSREIKEKLCAILWEIGLKRFLYISSLPFLCCFFFRLFSILLSIKQNKWTEIFSFLSLFTSTSLAFSPDMTRFVTTWCNCLRSRD